MNNEASTRGVLTQKEKMLLCPGLGLLNFKGSNLVLHTTISNLAHISHFQIFYKMLMIPNRHYKGFTQQLTRKYLEI